MKVADVLLKISTNIHQIFTGSEHYCFQRRREPIAQAEQEVPKGTLFWTFSDANNHWRYIMKIIDVPEHVSPEVKRQSVRRHPHIVDFFFCIRVERAAIHLFIKCLISDFIW